MNRFAHLIACISKSASTMASMRSAENCARTCTTQKFPMPYLSICYIFGGSFGANIVQQWKNPCKMLSTKCAAPRSSVERFSKIFNRFCARIVQKSRNTPETLPITNISQSFCGIKSTLRRVNRKTCCARKRRLSGMLGN